MLSSQSVSYFLLSAVSHTLFSFRWRVPWTRLALESQEVQGEKHLKGCYSSRFRKKKKFAGHCLCIKCLWAVPRLERKSKSSQDRGTEQRFLCRHLENITASWGRRQIVLMECGGSHSILLTDVVNVSFFKVRIITFTNLHLKVQCVRFSLKGSIGRNWI